MKKKKKRGNVRMKVKAIIIR